MARLIFLTTFLVALACQGLAQVQESSDSLVGRREHSFLTRLHESLSFPNTEMASGEAVVAVTVEGPNITIIAVGPIKSNAKAYAQKIEDWRQKSGFKGNTTYSQEDDCSAATLVIKTGEFGKMESILVVPVDEILRGVAAIEPRTKIALIAPAWTNLDTSVKPDYVAKNGMRYWDVTQPGKIGSTTSTLTIPKWIVPALIAWIFLPLVGFIICFGIGLAAAKNQSIPIEKRRKIYSLAVGKGIFIVLGLHAILVIATLPTRALDPVSQLWFGFRFSQIGLFVVPLFAIVPILLLPWLNKMETKLLGATPEEAAKKEDFSQYAIPPSDQPKRASLYLGLLWILIPIGILLLPIDRHSALYPFQRMAVPIYFIIKLIFMVAKKKPITEPLVPNSLIYFNRVQQRVQPIARRLEISCPPISITPLLQGPYGAAITTKSLMVTPALADRFSDEELDFVLAHELAHLKVNHLKIRRVLIAAPFLLLGAMFMALLLGRSLTFYVSPAFIFSPFLLILIVAPFYRYFVSKLFQKQEYDADEIAVRVTRHKDGAMRTLIKIAEQNSLPGFEEVAFTRTHPKIADRIARIRSLQNV
jgi:Zn-dependent protease with chaperone function